MGSFLKAIAVLYLVLLWGFFTLAMIGSSMEPIQVSGVQAGRFFVFITCVVSSIPAAVLYAFGSMVEDVREARDHLAAMRKYYEPRNREPLL